MKLKHKALVYNFIGFAIIFTISRILLGHFIPIQRILLAILAALTANVLAPKFAVARIEGEEKLVMKWILRKGIKEF